MNDVWPTGRTARASGYALVLLLGSACAHAAPAAQLGVASEPSQLARLATQLAERDALIQQLEGRLAMLAASESQLRERLESAQLGSALPAVDEPRGRETVRIGRRDKPAREPAAEPRLVLTSASEPRPLLRLQGDAREPRPLLRLQGDARDERRPASRDNDRELSSIAPPSTHPLARASTDWAAPVSTERLSVAQVPRLSVVHAPPSAAPASLAPLERKPVAAASTDAPADELYVHALDLLRRREFAEALRELDAFLRGYASDPRAARAQFFRGEILYAQREFARALQAFELSLVREPSSDKAPDTLLRIARCQTQLGAHERARAALHKLKTNFPNSEAARVAERVKQEDT